MGFGYKDILWDIPVIIWIFDDSLFYRLFANNFLERTILYFIFCPPVEYNIAGL